MSENKTTFRLRQGTQDALVLQEVITDNQYGLKDRLPGNGAIVDIGANIGAFAVACLTRGGDNVVCFEPDNACFNMLVQNTSAWKDKVSLHNAAIWRKDEPAIYCPQGEKTACGYVLPQRLCRVRTISVPTTDLDSVIESIADVGNGRVSLLKVDAEAAEYPILYTSKLLHRVDEIVGETHNYAAMNKADGAVTNEQAHGFPESECNIDGMVRFLESQGFTVDTKEEGHKNNINHLFWACRPSAPERLCHF